MGSEFKDCLDGLLDCLQQCNVDQRIQLLNEIQVRLSDMYPFQAPVNTIQWVSADKVTANDYNPNVVANPELELLRVSIQEDGVTQPIVVYPSDTGMEIVDGFHRYTLLKGQFNGYVPVVRLKQNRGGRIASTVRHNRARGKHQIESMSKIVIELSQLGWDNATIVEKLGMNDDEVLRLRQVTGLASLFKGVNFSQL